MCACAYAIQKLDEVQRLDSLRRGVQNL